MAMPVIPSVPRYAEENRCPHCKSDESIDVVQLLTAHAIKGELGMTEAKPGDEICHCNRCGGTFLQHYDRRFTGQTRSDRHYKSEEMPPERAGLIECAADRLSQFVEQLLERIEEKEDAWMHDTDDHDPPLKPTDVAQSFAALIESHTYKQVKKYLEELNKALGV